MCQCILYKSNPVALHYTARSSFHLLVMCMGAGEAVTSQRVQEISLPVQRGRWMDSFWKVWFLLQELRPTVDCKKTGNLIHHLFSARTQDVARFPSFPAQTLHWGKAEESQYWILCASNKEGEIYHWWRDGLLRLRSGVKRWWIITPISRQKRLRASMCLS